MNAKHALRIIEQSIANAKACFPDDGTLRARCFALMLSSELKACGEPAGTALADMVHAVPATAPGAA